MIVHDMTFSSLKEGKKKGGGGGTLGTVWLITSKEE